MSDERKQWVIGIIGVAAMTYFGLQVITSIYESFQREQAVEAQVVKNLDELKRQLAEFKNQLAEAREEIRDTHAGVDANAKVTWEQIDEACKRPKIKKPIIQGSFEPTHTHPAPPNADALFPIPDSVNGAKWMSDHAEKDALVCSDFGGKAQWPGDDNSLLAPCHFAQHLPPK